MIATIQSLRSKNIVLQNKVNYYIKKYNDVDISGLHNTIRDLENKVELYKNKHIFNKNIEETFKICTV